MAVVGCSTFRLELRVELKSEKRKLVRPWGAQWLAPETLANQPSLYTLLGAAQNSGCHGDRDVRLEGPPTPGRKKFAWRYGDRQGPSYSPSGPKESGEGPHQHPKKNQ